MAGFALKEKSWIFPMQYACLHCRKVFKKRVDFYKLAEERHSCPECEAEMHLMGRAFKAPAQRDVKQWKKVEMLIRSGFVFYPGRLRHYRERPNLKTLRDAQDFISSREGKLKARKRNKTIFGKTK